MHEKCIKYQDLVHGLIVTISDIMSEMNCVLPKEADELVTMMQTPDQRLTIDII